VSLASSQPAQTNMSANLVGRFLGGWLLHIVGKSGRMAKNRQALSVLPALLLCGPTACSSGSTSGKPSGNSGSSPPTTDTGGEDASTGSTPTGSATSTGTAAATGTGTGSNSGMMSGGGGANNGAQGVQCGASPCGPPMSCCKTVGADAGPAVPECVVACGGQQEQLCATNADCQQSGTSVCTNGVCTDMGQVILGMNPAATTPTDGGAPAGTMAAPAASDGGIPSGYPDPTADNAAKCSTTQPVGGVCPGGGAGPVCMECLFGGNMFQTTNVATPTGTMLAGNYAVTVKLGGAAAGQTFVSCEADRGLLHAVTTAAGQTAEYAFVVNVRANEGQPEEAQAAAGYPGLDLYFSGPTATPPQVSGIGYSLVTAATKPVMIYMASDSTECDQGENNSAFGGWGQMLPEYFAPPVGIANYGDSGESSSSFYGKADMWGAIKSHWTAGDWVIVQFGHNDKGVADSVVQANLEKYVTDALAANVTPILVSPPARVGSWTGNMLGDQSSLHAAAAQAAAMAKSVAYIDLTALSTAWYNTLGSKAAALAYHANGSDGTHTNLAGADRIAGLVATAIKTQNIGLAKYLR